MRTKDTLAAIELEILEHVNGGRGRATRGTQRWQTAQGRKEIGEEFHECMTSATRPPGDKFVDWVWAGISGGYSDQRTPRDCLDAYNKEMGVPR